MTYDALAISYPRSNDPLASFLTSLDRFLVEHVDARAIDAAHRIPDQVLRGLADLGAFGVTIPEAYGGSGLGLLAACRVVDVSARRDRAVATTVGLHLGLGTRPLVAFGTAAQKARWLPELAAGSRIAAFAATEPGAGSDLSRLATRAVIDGERVRVDGQKLYVTNGRIAGLYTLAVASDLAGGGALIVLEREDSGLSVGPEERKLGLRGSSTTPITLAGVEVESARLIGPTGAGAAQLGHTLAWGRTAMAAGCCGTAQAALDATLAHVRLRHQFGRTLAAQPVVRAQVADMVATLHTMRALVVRAATAPDAAEHERLSLAAKIFCSDGDWAICDLALQLHGGSGYLEDTGLPLLLRDARITRVFEGANDVLASRLGQIELTAPRPPTADLIGVQLSERLAAARSQGLAALRDPVLMHQIGHLAVVREAAASLVPPATAADRHALIRLSESALAIGARSSAGVADLAASVLDLESRQ